MESSLRYLVLNFKWKREELNLNLVKFLIKDLKDLKFTLVIPPIFSVDNLDFTAEHLTLTLNFIIVYCFITKLINIIKNIKIILIKWI